MTAANFTEQLYLYCWNYSLGHSLAFNNNEKYRFKFYKLIKCLNNFTS